MFTLRKLLCVAVAGFVTTATPAGHASSGERMTAADAGVAVTTGPGPEAFRVLNSPGSEGPEITPYLLYQTSMAWHQDAMRRSRWSQVKSEADLLALRRELRKSVLEMIGGLPTEKTDLHATVTGKISADGFHVEKLLYQSIPGLYVTALVYVPDDSVKIHPAVLVPAGHSPKGKIYYQRYARGS